MIAAGSNAAAPSTDRSSADRSSTDRSSTARTGRAAPLSRDDRRAAIAAATVPLLVEHGAGVTTKQIADAAGVAEGTLFRAFADKGELLRAAAAAALDPARAVAGIGALPDDLGLEELVRTLAEMLQRGLSRTARVMTAAHQVLAEEARAARRAGTPDAVHAGHGPLGGHGPHGSHHMLDAVPTRDARLASVLAVLGAVSRRLEPHADELRVTPESAAQILVSLVFGLGPPGMLTATVFTPDEITEHMLHGIVART